MNIFLTGATGFVGAELIQSLAKDLHKHFYVLYRSNHKKMLLLEKLDPSFHSRIHFVYGDITNECCDVNDHDINNIPQIDKFYHLAALVKFNFELADELYHINYIGTKHALDLAERLQTKHFLYVSTAYTVGKKDKAEETLHSLESPTHNPYEATKIKAEHIVAQCTTMATSIIRPAIIIGDSKTGEADSNFTLYGFMKALKVFKRRVQRQQDNNSYRLFGDASHTSNFVPVDYVVDVLTVACDYAENHKIYHATNNNPPSNDFIFQTIKHHLDFHQLEVAPLTEINTITDDERVLNSFIDVFAPYFSKSIEFNDDNTAAMMEKAGQSTLNLTDDTLDMIIGMYFKK
ncbi:SDR family oxidoreductase [Mammaliicoccus vitulinus]|uniref:SDR family oxidoreductase n=1 Tax=Mammaliicoccus vitulinus TaxID=71237 RepID=UPI0002F3DBE8|nr:SDR family oxidoreductase [Mammaliicoccus vitulinus]MBM6629026.1 SDR family oxidoreductase [Mammaliicoccus vitulinus]MEB7657215.1 SDR family oxidoreductase [Mammaliicoccus vitulinus]